MNLLRRWRDGNPFVVKLDLLACLKVVIDNHLPVPTDQRAADFDRGQPVDVDVCDAVVSEEQRKEGSILGLPRNVAVPSSGNGHRRTIEQKGHYRKVVDRKIP